MLKRLLAFYRASPPAPVRQPPGGGADALYKRLRWQVLVAGTLGYSLFYVCRTTLNVIKKPMLDAGLLDPSQLGTVGSALFFTYAIGKFVNGFLADHANIKRLMATGLALSATANLVVGVMGFVSISSAVLAAIFAVMWGISGWGQSVGSPCAVIGLTRWYPLRQRGTYYGIFSLSHNLGEWLSFLFVGLLVSGAGWQWGFWGAALAGVAGVAIILLLLHDNPESRGLPAVEVLAGEASAPKAGPSESTLSLQRLALRTPGVWILAGASAFMYMSRYAVNSWGVLFLQETKAPMLRGLEPVVRDVLGFFGKDSGEGNSLLVVATSLISINALLGIFGTVLSGWFSDKFFKGSRRAPALIFGVSNALSLGLFLYGGNSAIVNIISMVLFGISIGVLICFLGGLMAVDLVPRKAAGAAMGVVGLASYVAAGLQEIVSGRLIDARVTVVEGVKHYDFSHAAFFWLAASIISFLLPLLCRKKPPEAQ
ncbi:MAG: MFS transporter [Opitutaceae bacterium]|jgi:OPA family sugar phosphate sensor protein UhpC-like MFS transporter|nr:MFS transporter [Opitutaceae bacterium]